MSSTISEQCFHPVKWLAADLFALFHNQPLNHSLTPEEYQTTIRELVEVDKTKDHQLIYQTIISCTKRGISFQEIESELRKNACATFLIAMDNTHFTSTDMMITFPASSEQKKYMLVIAMNERLAMDQIKERSQTYDENFRKLQDTGFITAEEEYLPNFITTVPYCPPHTEFSISLSHSPIPLSPNPLQPRIEELLREDKTRDYIQVSTQIANCCLAGLSFQAVESILRQCHAYTYLIARKREDGIPEDWVRSLSGIPKTYQLFVSSLRKRLALKDLMKESRTYEENYRKLEDTGFAFKRI